MKESKKSTKKKLTMVLSVALVAVMLIAGTMAYLTDTDSDVNVMTLGNVFIAQHEYQRAIDESGAYITDTIDNQTSYVLEDFKQAKSLLPIVGDPSTGAAGWDTIPVRMSQVDSYGGMDVFAGKNAVDKFVTVENTGKTDAYVRTLVAIEAGSTDGSLIGSSYHQTWTSTPIGVIEIDGNNYCLTEYVYNGAELSDGSWRHENGILPAGDTSYPNLSQVYLKSAATNEDMEAIDGNGNGTLDILVLSQAVQAEGFADAETALNAAFGDVTVENHPWGDYVFDATEALSVDNETGTYSLTSDAILTDEPLYSDITATSDVTIDGNGKTVTMVASSEQTFDWDESGTIPQFSNIFSSSNGSKVTVNDLTIEGTMQSVMMGNYVAGNSTQQSNFNTEFNNVNIVGTEVVSFSAGISPAVTAYGTATLNNCNIYGTTLSALDTAPMWPVYDLAVVNYSDTILNNCKVGSIYAWNQAKLTVADGSEVDTIVVRGNMSTTKYGITIKEGATVGIIDLSNITDKARVNITIENGATVGGFGANGVTYETIDAWKSAE